MVTFLTIFNIFFFFTIGQFTVMLILFDLPTLMMRLLINRTQKMGLSDKDSTAGTDRHNVIDLEKLDDRRPVIPGKLVAFIA